MNDRCVLREMMPGNSFPFEVGVNDDVGPCSDCIRQALSKTQAAETAILDADEFGPTDVFYGYDSEVSMADMVLRTQNGYQVEHRFEQSLPIPEEHGGTFSVTTMGKAAIECERLSN